MRPRGHVQPRVHHVWMSHALPCIVCILLCRATWSRSKRAKSQCRPVWKARTRLCSATFTRSSTGIASKSDTLIVSFRHIGAIACAVIYVLPAQRYASAGTSYGPVSVCLSVCLSITSRSSTTHFLAFHDCVGLSVGYNRAPGNKRDAISGKGWGSGEQTPVRPRKHVVFEKTCATIQKT